MTHRILLVAHNGTIVGANVALLSLARGLDRTRYSVTMLVPDDGPLAQELTNALIDFVYLPMQFASRKPRPLTRMLCQIPFSVPRLVQILKSRHIDLVHCNTIVNIQPALAACAAHTPLVWHLHEIPVPTIWRRLALW